MRLLPCCLLLCCLLCCHFVLAAQQVYLSYSKDGTPLYSDQPSAGATLIQLHTAVPTTTNTATTAATLPTAAHNRPLKPSSLQLQILQPSEQQSLLSNAGELQVQTTVTPALPGGHQLRLMLDQSQLSPPQQDTRFLIQGMERGEHQLQLQLLDQNGKLIAESPVTRFYLRKSSIISPN